jgi:hypothetical protein
MAQPRKFATNAERQAAYRLRKQGIETHRPDDSVAFKTTCGLDIKDVFLVERGAEPTCAACHTWIHKAELQKVSQRAAKQAATVTSVKEIRKARKADWKAQLDAWTKEGEEKEVTPPVVIEKSRLKFPKRKIDSMFRRFYSRRLTAAQWRTMFDKVEAKYGSCAYGKDMFRGARERMETTIKHAESLTIRNCFPQAYEEAPTVTESKLDAVKAAAAMIYPNIKEE